MSVELAEEIGRKMGMAVGEELGYYRGVAEHFLNSGPLAPSAARAAEKICAAVAGLLARSPESAGFASDIERVRSTFRMLVRRVKRVDLEYPSPVALSNQALDF